MGRKLLLDKAHVENIRLYDVYRREGGYRSVEKALKSMSPDQVTDEVKKSGFIGIHHEVTGYSFRFGQETPFHARRETRTTTNSIMRYFR